MISTHPRNYGLDIFRSISIIFVVVVHGSFMLDNTFLNGFPYIPMIDTVDMFFVLSGFLIGLILIKEINQSQSYNPRDILIFWKRRWFRTLPNYYLFLFLNIVLTKLTIINNDIHHLNWSFFFCLQNFNHMFQAFFWESWSLCIEEWFYILFPILLFILLKKINAKYSFLIATVIMIVFPILLRAINTNSQVDDYIYENTFRKIVIFRLDSIAYGLLAAWVYYYYNLIWVKLKYLFLSLGLGLIYFLLHFDAPNTGFYKQVVHLVLSPVAAMLILPFMESMKTGKGILVKVFTHISKISYSMYLVNLALVSQIISANFPIKNETDGIIKYVIYWALVIAISTLIYRYFEKPIMKLRDK